MGGASSSARLSLRANTVLYDGENHLVRVTGIPECAKMDPRKMPEPSVTRDVARRGYGHSDWYGRKFPRKGRTVRFSFEVIRADSFNVVRIGFPPIPVP